MVEERRLGVPETQIGGTWKCVMGSFREAWAAGQFRTFSVELGKLRPEIGRKVIFLLS